MLKAEPRQVRANRLQTQAADRPTCHKAPLTDSLTILTLGATRRRHDVAVAFLPMLRFVWRLSESAPRAAHHASQKFP